MLLVSILGDFHSSVLPIYYQFKDDISEHIVIYDDYKSDIREAQNIIKGLKSFNSKYNLKIKMSTYCIDEDSYEAIMSAIEFITESIVENKNIYINTTDGLSNINTLIALKLLPHGVNLISYDRYDNEVNIIQNESMTTYRIDKIIPIQDHFLLRNLEVVSIADKNFANKYKNEILELFEKRYEEFKGFANYVQNTQNPTLDNKEYENINKIINRLNLKDIKFNQGLITGGLFEYYIYLKVKELDFDDIEIGVTVRKNIDKINFLSNEFDILIMKDNHLHMIECKFTKNIKLDNIVYKYMGLKSLLDDDGKICIVTGHKNPHNLSKSTNPVEYQPYKRALANKILLKGNPMKDINKFVSEVKDYFVLKN